MRTNTDIDGDLMAKAMIAMNTKTKKDTVEEALRAAVRVHEQLEALEELRGLGWDGDLDDMRTSKYLPEA